MISNTTQEIQFSLKRNDNFEQLKCVIKNQPLQTIQENINADMTCTDKNGDAQRTPKELMVPHQVDPNCNNDNHNGTCEMEICTLDGATLTCLPYAPQKFTNVYEFKSRKGRNVESFSQNTNGKCKARY
jgi:hypothetical protein